MQNAWALQDAKARLSEVVRAAKKAPQKITLRGEEAAFIVSPEDFRKLKGIGSGTKTLYEALRACPYELKIPPRSNDRGRAVKL
jgi:prevent-host-death family protein